MSFFLVGLATGCGGEPAAPEESVTAKPATPIWIAASGQSVPEDEAVGNLNLVARRLALALSDASTRQSLYTAIHASTFREHKVQLASLLLERLSSTASRPAERLIDRLDAIDDGSGLRGSGVVAGALDRLMKIEVYLPVSAHFTRWAGGPEILVGTALRDHVAPVLYDVHGGRVVWASTSTPPTAPVLAVVPAEGDPIPVAQVVTAITCPPEDPDCSQGGGGGAPPAPSSPGLWMTFSHIDNGHSDYEGWLMGQPEFEVILASYTTESGGFSREYQCAGAKASELNTNQPGIKYPDYVYDQNGDDWTGVVKLATPAQMTQAETTDSGSIVMVWEDDADACQVRQDRTTVASKLSAASALATFGRAFLKKPNSLGGATAAVGIVTTFLVLLPNLNADDFVGLVSRADMVGVSYGDADHAIHRDGTIVGRARLVYVE